jgi:seryl-tRNA synthetase
MDKSAEDIMSELKRKEERGRLEKERILEKVLDHLGIDIESAVELDQNLILETLEKHKNIKNAIKEKMNHQGVEEFDGGSDLKTLLLAASNVEGGEIVRSNFEANNIKKRTYQENSPERGSRMV